MPWFQLSQLEDLQEGFRFRLVFEAPCSVVVGRELVSIQWFPIEGILVDVFAEEDRLHGEQTERQWWSFDTLPSRFPRFERALSEPKEHQTARYIWILVQDLSWQFEECFGSLVEESILGRPKPPFE